jgi:cyclopropane fatty-acyl-phospholipid synthase-like methyltransferase
MTVEPEHGFTAVDKQEDPTEWVAVHDKLAAEPFYATYKRRCLELLEPRHGGHYLDVGAGAGDDAFAIASSANCTVIGIFQRLSAKPKNFRSATRRSMALEPTALFSTSSIPGALLVK